MGRATKALGGLTAALLAAGLARADPTDCGAQDVWVSTLPPPALEYRPHPVPRRGYDRVRRATPPRVDIGSASYRHYGELPYAVYVDPWRRRPDRPGPSLRGPRR